MLQIAIGLATGHCMQCTIAAYDTAVPPDTGLSSSTLGPSWILRFIGFSRFIRRILWSLLLFFCSSLAVKKLAIGYSMHCRR